MAGEGVELTRTALSTVAIVRALHAVEITVDLSTGRIGIGAGCAHIILTSVGLQVTGRTTTMVVRQALDTGTFSLRIVGCLATALIVATANPIRGVAGLVSCTMTVVETGYANTQFTMRGTTATCRVTGFSLRAFAGVIVEAAGRSLGLTYLVAGCVVGDAVGTARTGDATRATWDADLLVRSHLVTSTFGATLPVIGARTALRLRSSAGSGVGVTDLTGGTSCFRAPFA